MTRPHARWFIMSTTATLLPVTIQELSATRKGATRD